MNPRIHNVKPNYSQKFCNILIRKIKLKFSIKFPYVVSMLTSDLNLVFSSLY